MAVIVPCPERPPPNTPPQRGARFAARTAPTPAAAAAAAERHREGTGAGASLTRQCGPARSAGLRGLAGAGEPGPASVVRCADGRQSLDRRSDRGRPAVPRVAQVVEHRTGGDRRLGRRDGPADSAGHHCGPARGGRSAASPAICRNTLPPRSASPPRGGSPGTGGRSTRWTCTRSHPSWRRLSITAQYLTDPTAPVVLPTPAYMPFLTVPELIGRELITVPMRQTGRRYELDLDGDRRRAAPGALFVLTNPHNPTGRVFSPGNCRRWPRWCRHAGATVFADEIHAPLVYPGRTHRRSRPSAGDGRPDRHRHVGVQGLEHPRPGLRAADPVRATRPAIGGPR